MAVTEQHSFIDRAIGAARLDADIYEEVEHDRGATMQAANIVALGSVAAGIGAIAEAGLGGLVLFSLVGLVGWAVYAYLTYLIGTRLLAGPETSADWGELARTLGFANAPRVLLILGVIPVVGLIVGAAVFIWVLVATVVAVRAALDFSTGRAIGTALLGWLAEGVLFAVALGILVG